MPKKLKFPEEILVYQCDEVDGEPVYSVARRLSDISEDYDGDKIGLYVLQRVDTLRIKRELE